MTLTLIDIAVLFGWFQGLVVGLVILFSRFFRSESNRYLGLSLLTVSAMIAGEWLLELGKESIVVVVFTDIMWEYLFPVFFLKYFLYALNNPLRKNKAINLLYLPFLLTAFINIIIDLDLDFELYHVPAFHDGNILSAYYQLEYVGSILFVVVLDVWAYRIIQCTKQQFPNKWTLQFWWMATLLIFLWVVIYVIAEWSHMDFFKWLWAFMSIAFFWITYRGCFQFKLAEDKFEIRQILAQKYTDLEAPPSATRELPENHYFQRLERMMLEQHRYRDPNLNRDKVASDLGISSGYLSQLLNARNGNNFSEYINAYRIREVKSMLVDPEFKDYSLLSIGYEAGFNSKSTFYATFKKSTGLTPSAYRNQHK